MKQLEAAIHEKPTEAETANEATGRAATEVEEDLQNMTKALAGTQELLSRFTFGG